jgi:hypothetical protein
MTHHGAGAPPRCTGPRRGTLVGLTVLRRYELADPVLCRLAQIVHEADLQDDRFDAPEAAGLDAVLRG